MLLQDGSSVLAAAAAISGFPLSNAKISEKRKFIEELGAADVKKVRIGPCLWITNSQHIKTKAFTKFSLSQLSIIILKKI